MHTGKLAISSVLILIGPFVTLYLVVSGKGESAQGQQVVHFVLWVSLMSIVTAAISALMHRHMRMLVALPLSVIVSEVAYVLLALLITWLMPSGRQRAESLMWLPLAAFFLVYFGFPTAVSVSWGTGILVRDFVETNDAEAMAPRPY